MTHMLSLPNMPTHTHSVVHNMTLDDARLNVSVYKNSSIAHRQESGCSNLVAWPGYSARDARIEIESIFAYQRNIFVFASSKHHIMNWA